MLDSLSNSTMEIMDKMSTPP
ncbi:hypothetical protein MCW_01142, partial [Cardidatus Bartonella washoeensis 085-0475]